MSDKRKRIITKDISLPIGSAANTAVVFSKKLFTSGYTKCRGFGLSITSDPGVAFNVSLEPVNGIPLIDPVNSNYVKLPTNIKLDEILKTVLFDIPSEDTVVRITPLAITTALLTAQAIFELTED